MLVTTTNRKLTNQLIVKVILTIAKMINNVGRSSQIRLCMLHRSYLKRIEEKVGEYA